MTQGKLRLSVRAVLFLLAGFLLIGLLLFGPAGTFSYWQAWAFLLALFLPISLVLAYLLRRDPALLERRMQHREPEPAQRAIIRAANAIIILAFLVPGLDRRFGWSSVPAPLSVAADVLILLGYAVIFLVFRENSYTSRTVEVARGQKLVDTGPYALVRHPMYTGMALLFLAIPPALGSYWALAGFVPAILILAVRAVDEERVLRRDLAGYAAYCERVRYRLVPRLF